MLRDVHIHVHSELLVSYIWWVFVERRKSFLIQEF